MDIVIKLCFTTWGKNSWIKRKQRRLLIKMISMKIFLKIEAERLLIVWRVKCWPWRKCWKIMPKKLVNFNLKNRMQSTRQWNLNIALTKLKSCLFLQSKPSLKQRKKLTLINWNLWSRKETLVSQVLQQLVTKKERVILWNICLELLR